MATKEPNEKKAKVAAAKVEEKKYEALFKRSEEISREANFVLTNKGNIVRLLAENPSNYIREVDKILQKYEKALENASSDETAVIKIGPLEYTRSELLEMQHDLTKQKEIIQAILDKRDISNDDLGWLEEAEEFKGLVDSYRLAKSSSKAS